MIEHAFICPFCLQPISMVIDTSVPQQTYIEDCEVCCNPIEITAVVEEGELTNFVAERSHE